MCTVRQAAVTDAGAVPDQSRPWLTRLEAGSWRVAVRVQPGAKKNEITGVMDGRVRIRLMAQAVENKANKALVAFVAETLGVRPNRVRLASGETGREKALIVTSEAEPCWEALSPLDTPK